MFQLLTPRRCVDTLYDIDPAQLKAEGIKGIIFDLDNTIIPWDKEDMCPTIIDWLHLVVATGFKVALVSNNWNKRVKTIADQFQIPFVSRAYKPAKSGFHQALTALKLAPHETAVIGDQLLTDILGGNRMGMYTVWVKPLTAHEFIGTRLHRKVERIVVRMLKAKGLMK